MHRVTTGRLIARVTAAGDTVLGTVPAGKVWQVLGAVNSSGSSPVGAVGEVRFRDAGGVVRVRVAQVTATATPVSAVGAIRINLAAGDQVVYNSSRVAAWGVIVPYFER